ncbi:Glo1 [Symbiodinium pilosum]|uniref:Glo1 protein n=1 Tax=Symbiodinium pilosum TaxID=2952 RepID=A0A812IUQ9_SYMPI|nr:Glo1 [Symbiodinium pilosum]
MSVLPDISPGASREKPKTQFLKETYDVSFDGGEARDNLWKTVLPQGQTGKRREAKAQELMQERQRAEERAEKRWRQKFEEWQANFQSDMASEVCKDRSEPEAHHLREPELEELKGRTEAAEKECAELREECKGQLDELARLYEEFRRAHQKVQEEKARRETIEKHLGSAVEEQGKWTEKLAHRMSQLQQARQQRRAIGARIAQFGNELHTLDLRTGEWVSQVANDRGREMPSMEEELGAARAAAEEAESQVAEAEKLSKELQEFLTSPEVLSIDSVQQEVDRMSFKAAFKDAWEPWALEEPSDEATELGHEADQLSPSSAQGALSFGEDEAGSQSPQSPQSPYEDFGDPSPESTSPAHGPEENSDADEVSPLRGDPSSPQAASELDESYAIDQDAFEEPPSPASPGSAGGPSD